MKFAFLSVFIFFFVGAVATSATETTQAEAGLLRHIVMVQFKEETGSDKIKALEAQFAALEDKIETIIDYEWGLASTAEKGLDQGFTHCFVVTFKDKSGLEVYLPHQAHQDFVKVFKPEIEKLLVLDYVSK